MFFAHYDILNLNFTLIVIHLLSVFVYLKNNKMNHVNGVLIFKRNITLRILIPATLSYILLQSVTDCSKFENINIPECVHCNAKGNKSYAFRANSQEKKMIFQCIHYWDGSILNRITSFIRHCIGNLQTDH